MHKNIPNSIKVCVCIWHLNVYTKKQKYPDFIWLQFVGGGGGGGAFTALMVIFKDITLFCFRYSIVKVYLNKGLKQFVDYASAFAI